MIILNQIIYNITPRFFYFTVNCTHSIAVRICTAYCLLLRYGLFAKHQLLQYAVNSILITKKKDVIKIVKRFFSTTPRHFIYGFFPLTLTTQQYPVDIVWVFNYINYLILIFVPLLLLFFMYAFNILSVQFRNKHTFWYLIFPLIIVTCVFYTSPVIMLLFSFAFTGLLLNLMFAPFFEHWLSKRFSSENILAFLKTIGLLPFFFRLFSFVFCISSSKQFIIVLCSTHLLSLFYVIFCRYLVYITVFTYFTFPLSVNFLLFIGIFICLFSLLFRLLINLSIVVVSTSIPLWEHFLVTEPGYDPSKIPSRHGGGWFNRYNYHYNYGQNPIPPRLSLWKATGFTIGVCTLAVGCATAYYSYVGAEEARKLTLAAQKQTLEAQEANRLKRYELAKADPRDADIIFKGFPEELTDFKRRK
jgi:hypothetical protein